MAYLIPFSYYKTRVKYLRVNKKHEQLKFFTMTMKRITILFRYRDNKQRCKIFGVNICLGNTVNWQFVTMFHLTLANGASWSNCSCDRRSRSTLPRPVLGNCFRAASGEDDHLLHQPRCFLQHPGFSWNVST